MTIATTEVSVTSSGWTLLCENVENAYIQLRSDGPVLIHGAPTAPGSGVTTGAVLSTAGAGLRAVQMVALAVGDKLYGRATGNETEYLTVITT